MRPHKIPRPDDPPVESFSDVVQRSYRLTRERQIARELGLPRLALRRLIARSEAIEPAPRSPSESWLLNAGLIDKAGILTWAGRTLVARARKEGW